MNLTNLMKFHNLTKENVESNQFLEILQNYKLLQNIQENQNFLTFKNLTNFNNDFSQENIIISRFDNFYVKFTSEYIFNLNLLKF